MALIRPSTALTLWLLLLVQHAAGILTGSGLISYTDYFKDSLWNMEKTPPSCGMPYVELNRVRITALAAMDKKLDCGKCIKVTNSNDVSKSTYVMVVDTGGDGLSLSKQAFKELFDVKLGRGPAKWEPADSSHCKGIWTPGTPPMGHSNHVMDVVLKRVTRPRGR